MNDRRYSFIPKLITWIFAEIILNWVGLDNLADYGEFLFDSYENAIRRNINIFVITLVESTAACPLAPSTFVIS
jgi:hypothetical protein